MRYFMGIMFLLLSVSGCNSADKGNTAATASGRIDYLNNFPSLLVQARNVEIWLPRQYFANPQQRFPVLYMHDGQNLFNTSTSTLNVAWEVDDTAQQLIDSGKIRPVIIVGIWSTDKRLQEYFPVKAADYFTKADKDLFVGQNPRHGNANNNENFADKYLQFLVEELKPRIDAAYRTLPDKDNTFISGSSMGGLISMYAMAEYPKVFGKAACVSTHWPILTNNDNMSPSEGIRKYMINHFPAAGDHQIYFDFGTETLDQYYEVHQTKVDAIMRAKGYVENRDWVTRKFPGAAHSEVFWQKRVDIVLEFLLKKQE
ncbi:MAG TPA: alpha/beta hydrolase-fold protein [Cellvibrio sp.]|nr:alpha/beta hydrolase-fold protein [Cellvibrio sp.]